MKVYLNQKEIALNTNNIVGEGGEAVIYKYSHKNVIKLFKSPQHPDFTTLEEQQAVQKKLIDLQKKLISFPSSLPANVLFPKEVITDSSGFILGYKMPFINDSEVLKKYSEKQYRTLGIDNNDIVEIFKKMFSTVKEIHKNDLIIGDFNDLNIMIKNNDPYFIDVDSYQFNNWLCSVFTTKFVDPLLCNSDLILEKPFTKISDWYSFSVMLLQSLLLVHPYGGIYRPTNKEQNIPHGERPLHGVSIFRDDVRFPKFGIPINSLPDDILDFFYDTFEKKQRKEFSEKLLDMEWKICSNCNTYYAKNSCPNCEHISEERIKEKVMIKGEIKATEIFKCRKILFIQELNNELFVIHTDKQLADTNEIIVRNHNKIKKFKIDYKIFPPIRFRVFNFEPVVGLGNSLILQDKKMYVDVYKRVSMFDTNKKHLYWIENGVLYRDNSISGIGMYDKKELGKVLENQTLFWVGDEFGLGFYRAGNYTTVFTFDAEHGNMNDTIKLPFKIKGQLLESTCYFSNHICWFLVSIKEKNDIVNHCVALNQAGEIFAYTNNKANPDMEITLKNIRGNCAVGNNMLFCTTDLGMQRLRIENGGILLTEFPDTEPFLDSESYLFHSISGLTVTDTHTITELEFRK
jgi:serine/threonine protein kinase